MSTIHQTRDVQRFAHAMTKTQLCTRSRYPHITCSAAHSCTGIDAYVHMSVAGWKLTRF